MIKKLAIAKLLKLLTVSSVVVGGGVLTYKHFSAGSVVVPQIHKVQIQTPSVPEQPRVFTTYLIKDVTLHDARLDSSRIVLISGAIRDLTPQIMALKEMAEDSSDPIYVVLDSPGGSVMGGTEFITAMKSVKAPVVTICATLCASMAFIIHQYGSQRWVTDHAILMSHPASIGGGMGGEVDKVLSGLQIIQRFVDKHNLYISKRVKMSYEEFKARSSIEMWLMSDEAIERGFADKAVSLSFEKVEVQVSPQEQGLYKHLDTMYNVK
jgi:ATP-dependent Clp protease protease subunit